MIIVSRVSICFALYMERWGDTLSVPELDALYWAHVIYGVTGSFPMVVPPGDSLVASLSRIPPSPH